MKKLGKFTMHCPNKAPMMNALLLKKALMKVRLVTRDPLPHSNSPEHVPPEEIVRLTMENPFPLKFPVNVPTI